MQERSWSPSWINWSMGNETEILFSLVREAMGNERVTTCSPTAGDRQGKDEGLEDPQTQTWDGSFHQCVCHRSPSGSLGVPLKISL